MVDVINDFTNYTVPTYNGYPHESAISNVAR